MAKRRTQTSPMHGARETVQNDSRFGKKIKVRVNNHRRKPAPQPYSKPGTWMA